jgi:hypothetical protein
MKKEVFDITIWNETFGKVVEEQFVDETQFSIFLKGVKACLDTTQDFSYFNGKNFLIHIPFAVLKKSVIFTKENEIPVSEIIKSKAEALVTKTK